MMKNKNPKRIRRTLTKQNQDVKSLVNRPSLVPNARSSYSTQRRLLLILIMAITVC